MDTKIRTLLTEMIKAGDDAEAMAHEFVNHEIGEAELATAVLTCDEIIEDLKASKAATEDNPLPVLGMEETRANILAAHDVAILGLDMIKKAATGRKSYTAVSKESTTKTVPLEGEALEVARKEFARMKKEGLKTATFVKNLASAYGISVATVRRRLKG